MCMVPYHPPFFETYQFFLKYTDFRVVFTESLLFYWFLPPPLILYHYDPLSLALASFVTDSHFVLSKALVLHIFMPIFLRSDTSSSIHCSIGIPFSFLILLICLPVTSFLPLCHPFLQHSQTIPIYVLQPPSVWVPSLLTKCKQHLPSSADLCSHTVCSDSFDYLLKTWEAYVIQLHYSCS